MTRKRIVLLGIFTCVLALAAYGYSQWRVGTINGGQKYAEPFRIAGNLYYVGANDVTSFLITTPQGHVLIDGGYPGTPKLIEASIAKLGFNIRDVKMLLNSHWHYDHAGGLAELQKASGAQLWISEGDSAQVASGGKGDASVGALRFITYLPILRYPRPRIDHVFKDGETFQLGGTEFTAHVTAGHTRGCTSWSFPVRDGVRNLLAIDICSLKMPEGISLVPPESYPGARSDFEKTFVTLHGLPADIWLATHGREFGRYRKFLLRGKSKNPADPFIDRAGYAAAIDSAETLYRKELARQEREGPPTFMRTLRGR